MTYIKISSRKIIPRWVPDSHIDEMLPFGKYISCAIIPLAITFPNVNFDPQCHYENNGKIIKSKRKVFARRRRALLKYNQFKYNSNTAENAIYGWHC